MLLLFKGKTKLRKGTIRSETIISCYFSICKSFIEKSVQQVAVRGPERAKYSQMQELHPDFFYSIKNQVCKMCPTSFDGAFIWLIRQNTQNDITGTGSNNGH